MSYHAKFGSCASNTVKMKGRGKDLIQSLAFLGQKVVLAIYKLFLDLDELLCQIWSLYSQTA